MPLLDSVIHKHLDIMDEMKADIEKDIDVLINEIDIDAVIASPQETLTAVAEVLQELLIEKYSSIAVKEGIKLSNAIKKDGEIVVADTENQNLNKDIL